MEDFSIMKVSIVIFMMLPYKLLESIHYAMKVCIDSVINVFINLLIDISI